MTRRFVRSPAPPKITIAQGGAGTALSAASDESSVVISSSSSLRGGGLPFGRRPRHFRPSNSLATATTRSGSKPNLRCNSFSGAEAPKVFMPMTRADIAVPAEHRPLLDGEARLHRGRQHAIPIGLRLLLENVPGRHRDNARSNSLSGQRFMGLDDQRHLAAR